MVALSQARVAVVSPFNIVIAIGCNNAMFRVFPPTCGGVSFLTHRRAVMWMLTLTKKGANRFLSEHWQKVVGVTAFHLLEKFEC